MATTDASSTHTASPPLHPISLPPNAVKRSVYAKRTFARHAPLDSPAYDASEEDNDPLTDDGASTMSGPTSSHHRLTAPNSPLRSTARPIPQPNNHHTPRHYLPSSVSLSDAGIDSPTYDGDIESSTTIAAATGRRQPVTASSFTMPPSASDTSVSTEDPGIPVTIHSPSDTPLPPSTTPIAHFVIPSAAATTNNHTAPRSSSVASPKSAKGGGIFDPARLTPEDIQAFVRDAIGGAPVPAPHPNLPAVKRNYTISPPPTGRPIRIYADGVYDLFHFGHALQLRQAKLSFPSVQLLVGVCSDVLCKEHKSRTIMNHAERSEAVRHCKWVDEVLPDAPWIITQEWIDSHQIDYVAHDEDPYVAVGHEDVYAFVKAQGKFLPTRRTPGVSTSELLERIVAGYRKRDFDAKLEKMGHAELKAEGSDYDDSAPSSRSGSVGRARGRKVLAAAGFAATASGATLEVPGS